MTPRTAEVGFMEFFRMMGFLSFLLFSSSFFLVVNSDDGMSFRVHVLDFKLYLTMDLETRFKICFHYNIIFHLTYVVIHFY